MYELHIDNKYGNKFSIIKFISGSDSLAEAAPAR